jgi:hypothetical protein
MPRSLAIALTVTDLAFLLYWSLAALSQSGLLQIPPEWMYANYEQRDVIAWNWSFLPIDLAFSVFGLMAVASSRAQDPAWRSYAIVSLTLTMAAGGMAVSYWTLLGEFNPSWFIPNLVLVLWPPFFMRRLMSPADALEANGAGPA